VDINPDNCRALLEAGAKGAGSSAVPFAAELDAVVAARPHSPNRIPRTWAALTTSSTTASSSAAKGTALEPAPCVIGLGSMGMGAARACLQAGLNTWGVDINPDNCRAQDPPHLGGIDHQQYDRIQLSGERHRAGACAFGAPR
jgi:hypothetical protein